MIFCFLVLHLLVAMMVQYVVPLKTVLVLETAILSLQVVTGLGLRDQLVYLSLEQVLRMHKDLRSGLTSRFR